MKKDNTVTNFWNGLETNYDLTIQDEKQKTLMDNWII